MSACRFTSVGRKTRFHSSNSRPCFDQLEELVNLEIRRLQNVCVTFRHDPVLALAKRKRTMQDCKFVSPSINQSVRSESRLGVYRLTKVRTRTDNKFNLNNKKLHTICRMMERRCQILLPMWIHHGLTNPPESLAGSDPPAGRHSGRDLPGFS